MAASAAKLGKRDISSLSERALLGFSSDFVAPSKKRYFSTQEFTRFLSTVSSQRRVTRSDVVFQTKQFECCHCWVDIPHIFIFDGDFVLSKCLLSTVTSGEVHGPGYPTFPHKLRTGPWQSFGGITTHQSLPLDKMARKDRVSRSRWDRIFGNFVFPRILSFKNKKFSQKSTKNLRGSTPYPLLTGQRPSLPPR